MLARGPAGYRFTAKALQHAVPDARVERASPLGDGGAISFALRLSGTLRGTGERIDALVNIVLRPTPSGSIETAEATMNSDELDRIREARLRP
jgi:hypothetical protein